MAAPRPEAHGGSIDAGLCVAPVQGDGRGEPQEQIGALE